MVSPQALFYGGIMERDGVEYTVVQLVDGTGWRWKVRYGGGKKIRRDRDQPDSRNQVSRAGD